MAICAILALGGIGFGVYEMPQVKTAKQQIADLKIEVKKDDGSTTTIETDQIEVKEADKTVVITDSIRTPTSVIRDTDQKYYLTSAVKFFPNGAIEPEYSIITIATNGELSCGIYETENKHPKSFEFIDGLPTPIKKQECDMTEHSGEVLDLIDGHMGNGAYSTIFILTADGNVEYVTYKGSDYGKIKKLELPHKVVRIWGDNKVSVGWIYDADAVLAQYDNGEIADLSDYESIISQ